MDPNHLTKPAVFLTKAQTLKNTLSSVLDDYEKYYVFHNKDPSVAEYENHYNNVISNLQKLSSDLFVVTNSVQNGIESVGVSLDNYYTEIEDEKTINQDFKQKLGIVQNEQNGSDEMINDFKDMYNLQYLTNFAMFGGLIAILLLLSKANKRNAMSV